MLDQDCGLSPAWSSPVYTAFSLIAAIDGDIPARMYDESKEYASKLEERRYSHLTEWPRLLAKRLQHTMEKLSTETVRELFRGTLRSEPSILAFQLGFEPYILERNSHLIDQGEKSLLFGCTRDTSCVGEEHAIPNDDEKDDNHVHFFRDGQSNSYRFSQWYTNAKLGDSGVWSDLAGAPAMSFSVPIRTNGIFAGVLSMFVPSEIGHSNEKENEASLLTADVETHEEEKRQNQLDELVAGPRQFAEQMFRNEVIKNNESIQSQATKLSEAMHKILYSHKKILSTCVAFCPYKFNHQEKQSFYIRKNADRSQTNNDVEEMPSDNLVTEDDDYTISPILLRDVEQNAARGVPGGHESKANATVDLDVPSGGQRFPHMTRPSDPSRLPIVPLEYDYRNRQWYEFAVRECKDFWSKPHFGEGEVGTWVVTYSVPFFRKQGEESSAYEVAGVVTVDVMYDATIKALFAGSSEANVNRITCFSCGHCCSLAYWTPKSRLIQSCICQRCVRKGLLPRNTRFKDLEFVADREWYEWWNRVRFSGREVYYGQKVQLRHKFSGEIVCMRLVNSDFHTGLQNRIDEANGALLKTNPVQVYQLSTDGGKDPYSEGSIDSWFTIRSPDHQPGEPVKWGSQIEFISVRWRCPLSVRLDASSVELLSPGAVDETADEEMLLNRWRLIPFSRGLSFDDDAMQCLNLQQGSYQSAQPAALTSEVEQKLMNIYVGIGGGSGFGMAPELTNPSTLKLLKPGVGDRKSSKINAFRPTRILELGEYGSSSNSYEKTDEGEHEQSNSKWPSLLGRSDHVYLHGGCILRLGVNIDVGSEQVSLQNNQWLSAECSSVVGDHMVGQERVFINDEPPKAKSSLSASQVLDVSDSGESSGVDKQVSKLTNYLAELLDSRTSFDSLWLLQLTSGGGGAVRPGDGFYLYHLASRRYLALAWSHGNKSRIQNQSPGEYARVPCVADIETGIPLESRSAAPLSLVDSVANATIFCAQRSRYVDSSQGQCGDEIHAGCDYFFGLENDGPSSNSLYGSTSLNRQSGEKNLDGSGSPLDASENIFEPESGTHTQFVSDDHSPIEVNERFFLQCMTSLNVRVKSSNKFWVGSLTPNSLKTELRAMDSQAHSLDKKRDSRFYSKISERVKSIVSAASSSKRLAIHRNNDLAASFRGEVVGGYAAIDACRVSSHTCYMLKAANKLHSALQFVEVGIPKLDLPEAVTEQHSLKEDLNGLDNEDDSADSEASDEEITTAHHMAITDTNLHEGDVLMLLDNLLHLTRFLQGAWIDHSEIESIVCNAKRHYAMDMESVKQQCGYGFVRSRLHDIVMDKSCFEPGDSWWDSIVFPSNTVTEEDEDLEDEDDGTVDRENGKSSSAADTQTGSRVDSGSGRSSYAEEVGEGSAPNLNACNVRHHRQVLVWEGRGVEILVHSLDSCINICKYLKIPQNVCSQEDITNAASTVALLGLARKVAAVAAYSLYLTLLDHRQACITASSYFDKLLQWACLRKTKGRPNSSDLVIPKEVEQHQDQTLAYLMSVVVQVILSSYRVALTGVPVQNISLLAFVARRSIEPPLPPRLIQLLNKVVCRTVENRSIAAEKQQGTREAEVLDDIADFVPIPSNQWAVVIHFLLQDNAAVVRGLLHPRAPIWHQLGISQPAVPDHLRHIRIRDKYTKAYEKSGVDSLVSVLRLCTRLCMGAVGVLVRRVVEVLGGCTLERLLHITFDETLTGPLFMVRAQCCHLLRVMFIEPHVIKCRNNHGELGTGVCASGTANLCASIPGVDAGLSANVFPQTGDDIIMDSSDSSMGPSEGAFLLKPGVMRIMVQWTPRISEQNTLLSLPDADGHLCEVSLLDVLIDKCSYELNLKNTSSIVSVLSHCSRGESDPMVLIRKDVNHNSDLPIEALGDCGVPAIYKKQVSSLVDESQRFFDRCITLSSKNELSMAVLTLATALIRRGALSNSQIATVFPKLLNITAAEQERDALSSDAEWRSDKKLLLRLKLRCCMLTHLICDYATSHQIHKFTAYFADRYRQLVEERNRNEFVAAVEAIYPNEGNDYNSVASSFVHNTWFDKMMQSCAADETLLAATHRNSWAPLLRLTVSLLYRFKFRANEIFKGFRDATVLFDCNESRFALSVASITWRLKGLTVVERTSAEPGEVHSKRAAEVASVAAMFLYQLHMLFANHCQHNISVNRAIDIMLASDSIDVVIELAKVPLGIVACSYGNMMSNRKFKQDKHPFMKVLRQAYAFLLKLAVSRDPTILTILRPHINSFLKYQGCSLGTIDLITELVKGCRRACALVDSSHIDSIVKRLASSNTSVSQKVLLVKFLRALMVDLGDDDDDYMCGDIISFRNRELVVNGLCSASLEGTSISKSQQKGNDVEASPSLHSLGFLSTGIGLLYFIGEIDCLCRPGTVLGSVHSWYRKDFDVNALRGKVAKAVQRLKKYVRSGQAHELEMPVSEKDDFSTMDSLEVGVGRRLTEQYQIDLYKRLLLTLSDSQGSTSKQVSSPIVDETTFRIRAALSWQGVLTAILSVTSFALKARLLQFLWSVWGDQLGCVDVEALQASVLLTGDPGPVYSHLKKEGYVDTSEDRKRPSAIMGISSIRDSTAFGLLALETVNAGLLWLHMLSDPYIEDEPQLDLPHPVTQNVKIAIPRESNSNVEFSGDLDQVSLQTNFVDFTTPAESTLFLRGSLTSILYCYRNGISQGDFYQRTSLTTMSKSVVRSNSEHEILYKALNEFLFEIALPFMVEMIGNSNEAMTHETEATDHVSALLFAVLCSIADHILSEKQISTGNQALKEEHSVPGKKCIEKISNAHLRTVASTIAHLFDPKGSSRHSGVRMETVSDQADIAGLMSLKVTCNVPDRASQVDHLLNCLTVCTIEGNLDLKFLGKSEEEQDQLEKWVPGLGVRAIPQRYVSVILAFLNQSKTMTDFMDKTPENLASSLTEFVLAGEGLVDTTSSDEVLRTIIILLIDDAFKAEESIRTRSVIKRKDVYPGRKGASCWLLDAPYVVSSFLHAFLAIGKSDGGQLRLNDLGVPQLVVVLLNYLGAFYSLSDERETVAGNASNLYQPAASVSGSDVIDVCLELGGVVLDGGFQPAQVRLLETYNATRSSGFLTAIDRMIIGFRESFQIPRKRSLRGNVSKALLKQLDSFRKASDIDESLFDIVEDDTSGDWSSAVTTYEQEIDLWKQIERLFFFVQQMCEGHMGRWQDELREQHEFVVQHNVVKQMTEFLHRLVASRGPLWQMVVYWDARFDPMVISQVMKSFIQVLATITEVTQRPCVGNQDLLSTSRLFESIGWVWNAILVAYGHHENTAIYGTWVALDGSVVDVNNEPNTRSGVISGVWTEINDALKDIFGTEGVETEIDVAAIPRQSLFMYVQDQVIECLSSVLEGDARPFAVRMVETLDLKYIPKLLEILLPAAEEEDTWTPAGFELSISSDRQRVSEGMWDGRFAELDLCCKYMVFIKRLSIRLGIGADLSVDEIISRAYSGGSNGPQSDNATGDGFLYTLSKVDDQFDYGTQSILRLLADPYILRLKRMCDRHVTQVEVQTWNSQLVPFVFRIPPVVLRHCKDADFKESRDNAIFSVSRDSPFSRMEDFINECPHLLFELSSYPRLRMCSLVRHVTTLMNFTFFLAILINVCLLGTHSHLDEWIDETAVYVFKECMLPLGLLHAITGVLRFTSVLVRKAPGWLHSAAMAGESDVRIRIKDDDLESDEVCDESVKEPSNESLAKKTTAKSLSSTGKILCRHCFSDPIVIFNFVYALSSILAVVLGKPALYSVHLFDLITRSALLRETLSALKAYSYSLVATGALWFLLM